MTDHPIIFSAPMIRALLDGRKTMTRRLAWRMDCGNRVQWAPSPWQRVQPGDRLWVREACVPRYFDGGITAYRADWTAQSADIVREPKWKPAIHMPRWASRLTLTVTATKIERLQEISEEDADAEGIDLHSDFAELCKNIEDAPYPNDLPGGSAVRAVFKALWCELHGADAWDANPEVVALTFVVDKRNIDAGDWRDTPSDTQPEPPRAA